MSQRITAQIGWASCAAAIALGFGASVFTALNWSTVNPEGASPRTYAPYLFALLVVPAIGALIVTRRPANPIGWTLCIIGLSFGALVFSFQYGIYATLTNPDSLPLANWMAWLSDWTWITALVPIVIVLQLFPEGRPLSHRWSLVLGLTLVTVVCLLLGFALRPGGLDDSPAVTNPVGIEALAGVLTAVEYAGFGLIPVIMLASGLAALLRLLRSSGEERLQVKWLAFAALLLVISYGVSGPIASLLDSAALEDAGSVLFGFALTGIPAAIGVAILKYRLYDIDRIISRTLTYGLLTMALAATYFGLVVSLQTAMRPVSGGSDLAIAGTTLAVAALFLPARRRIQGIVDRRFNRRAYDAARTVDGFSARLREQIDLDTLRYELLGVVTETMQPAKTSIWLRIATNRNDFGTP